MKALITGISGQDGYYLTQLLLRHNIEVHGVVRRHSFAQGQDMWLSEGDATTYYGDMTDPTSIEKILKSVKPDYIFNLAAQSHVRVSFDIPQYTFQVNALGVLNLLESYRRICPEAKFYQASSSEQFGRSVDDDGYQRETTPMDPVSPYGCAKVAAYNLVRHYRRAYGLHACNGILFNHESPRRGINFVSQKIVRTALDIRAGKEYFLELGNIDSMRDWGHSADYVRAMWLIVNADNAGDYVVATGKAYSVREMVDYVFEQLSMDYRHHLQINDKYMRAEELKYLRGDASKIRNELGWFAQYELKDILTEMINFKL